MAQAVQLVGALLVLAAFGALQFGYLSDQARSYLLLNLVGSTILAALALHEHQWGFFLLEAVWALVTAASLARPRAKPDANASQ